MMRTLSIGASGMQAQQTNVEVISNNIANMSTTAFYKQRAEFQDLLYQNIKRVGVSTSDNNTPSPSGIQLGSGVKLADIYRVTTQGDMDVTNNTYDMAIDGRGYFQVQMPDGTTSYTRAGNFQTDENSALVTSDGYAVTPKITIPQNVTDVVVNSSGQVFVKVAGQQTEQQVGQIQLANFPNPAGLEAIGQNLFQETTGSGNAVTGNPGTTGFGTINQGQLEESNVSVVDEITDLITAQRAYEMNSKVIQTGDEMLQTISQVK